MSERKEKLNRIALLIADASFNERKNCLSSALHAWKCALKEIDTYNQGWGITFVGLKYLCIENINRINTMHST